MRFLKEIKEIVKKNRFLHVCLAAILVLFVFKRGFMVILTHGESMEPTYNNGSVALVNKIFYDYSLPERWDVVVLYDHVSKDFLLKRIVGLPFEVIEIKRGRIYIDGEEINDPIDEPIMGHNFDLPPLEIPYGCYFYIGDSRLDSVWGLTYEEDIVGRVMN